MFRYNTAIYRNNNELYRVMNKETGELYYCSTLSHVGLILDCQTLQVKKMLNGRENKYTDKWSVEVVDGSEIKWKYINTGIAVE